jgi:cell division protein FtsB
VKAFLSIKNLIYAVVVAIFLMVSYNLVNNITSIWQRRFVIEQAEKELARVKEENTSLKSQLERVQKPGFVEEEARNKLFYVKPGEQIVYVPKQEEKPKEVEIVRITPWREWIALFF